MPPPPAPGAARGRLCLRESVAEVLGSPCTSATGTGLPPPPPDPQALAARPGPGGYGGARAGETRAPNLHLASLPVTLTPGIRTFVLTSGIRYRKQMKTGAQWSVSDAVAAEIRGISCDWHCHVSFLRLRARAGDGDCRAQRALTVSK